MVTYHRAGIRFKGSHLLQHVPFQGNRLFKEGKFELAKAKYEKASVVFSFLVLSRSNLDQKF